MKKFILTLYAALSLATLAHAQTFERMEFQDLTKPDSSVAKITDIWADVLAKNNRDWTNPLHDPHYSRMAPAQTVSDVISANGKLIIVSILSAIAAHCDNGANDATATLQPAKCPARVTIIAPGAPPNTIEVKNACFFGWFANDQTAPDRTKNASFVRYDPTANAVDLAATLNAQRLPDCDIHIQLH